MLAVVLALGLIAPDGGWEGWSFAPLDAGGIAPEPTPPSDVEIHGVRVPLIFDPNAPGNRPVEGAIPDAVDPGLQRPPAKPEPELSYDELMGSRLGELDACATWSPGGAAIKGWLQVAWTIETDGKPSHLRLLKSTLDSPLFESCVLKQIAAWRFPRPPEGPRAEKQQFFFDLAARELGGAELPEP